LYSFFQGGRKSQYKIIKEFIKYLLSNLLLDKIIEYFPWAWSFAGLLRLTALLACFWFILWFHRFFIFIKIFCKIRASFTMKMVRMTYYWFARCWTPKTEFAFTWSARNMIASTIFESKLEANWTKSKQPCIFSCLTVSVCLDRLDNEENLRRAFPIRVIDLLALRANFNGAASCCEIFAKNQIFFFQERFNLASLIWTNEI